MQHDLGLGLNISLNDYFMSYRITLEYPSLSLYSMYTTELDCIYRDQSSCTKLHPVPVCLVTGEINWISADTEEKVWIRRSWCKMRSLCPGLQQCDDNAHIHIHTDLWINFSVSVRMSEFVEVYFLICIFAHFFFHKVWPNETFSDYLDLPCNCCQNHQRFYTF